MKKEDAAVKSMLKYSLIFCITLALLLVNIIPVLVFWGSATISVYSLPPMAVMALVVINGVLSCVFKHKGNFLMIRKYRSAIFSADKDYTFTDEYEKEFRWMLLIYCAAIPFYIPIIFFASSWSQTLWTLLVFFIPQVIFIAHGIYQTVQDVKEEKRRQAQLEKERKEQERREELGYWK